jgi:cytochrome c553
MQNGDRGRAAMELMRSVVQKLDNADMLAIAAYAASLQP